MAGSNVFDRDLLIQALLTRIDSECNVLTGDHVAPDAGGWSTGQPGTGTFTAYSVLFTGPVKVTPSVFCTGCYDYSATFTIRSFGATRAQVDGVALEVRTALHTFKPQFGVNKVRLVWCSQIGQVDRLDDTNPKTWRIADTYTADCVPM